MKLHQLRMFVAVYQEHSFTAAAQRVYATQSGVSMQIKELEEELRVALFERSAKGVLPTTAGDRFYDHAIAILREADEAKRHMQALQGQESGTVTVGLMPTFSRSILTSSLSEFERTHPYVKLRIFEAYSAILTECVVREDIDFAIVPPAKPDARLSTEYVCRDRELFVTGASGPLEHLAPVALRSIGPLRLIVPGLGNARRDRIDAYLTAIDANVGTMIEMDAMMGTLELIACSDWCAILPGAVCDPDLAGSVRRLHPIIDPPLYVDYVLIQSAARTMTGAARAFADVLRRHIIEISGRWMAHGAPAVLAQSPQHADAPPLADDAAPTARSA